MSSIKHTLVIFKKLVEQIPPLVPEDIISDLKEAYNQSEHNMSLSLEELEDTMIVFGKKLWPYREAFFEFFRLYEGELGEKILLQKLQGSVRKHVGQFFKSGGTFRAFYTGASLIEIFTPEERQSICVHLIAVDKDIWKYSKQRVVSTDKQAYLKKIKEFQILFADMEQLISGLHAMAEDESEHPELSLEIREHIRTFEYGVSLLGPKVSHKALCVAPLHFQGRKKDKYHHRHVL
ncbi:MAG: hypothetical protein HOE80_04325 [Candidatus Magasanikbacteria bacterium]|nr:hypothetical protein [Candidatus Magasanikbacteria bacterium]MBT4071919.1 hypothetical protein [Candidatus Magasanikbacteria bacterium]